MIYLISTKHPEYAEREFSPGDVVIDPWRYVTDQAGVEVRRLGENKPALISLLCPTRGRPTRFMDMAASAVRTATHRKRIEIIVYLDEDDPTSYKHRQRVRYLRGPRILLSEMWNECYKRAVGEILMHCGDDIMFRTPGWDQIVRRVFAAAPDPYILVHGDDCSPNTDLIATHGFLHRRWVEAVGYFVPPLFSSDWNDVWLTEVADTIGRRVKVPIVTEHMHHEFGKSEYDETYRESRERGESDNVRALYHASANERANDVGKLLAAMRA